MANAWALSALWVGLALIATLLAIWFRVATALSEIIVGTVAQLVIGAFLGNGGLLSSTQWITFLAGTGAIVLTFLAGADLSPPSSRPNGAKPCWWAWLVSSARSSAARWSAHYILGWSMRSSWLCGVALSTTSVAVVYAVMLELGFNVTDYGKVDPRRLLRQRPWNCHCLGIDLFAFHAQDTHICRSLRRGLRCSSFLHSMVLQEVRWPRFRAGDQIYPLPPLRIGGLAVWAGSEAVLPAYMIGDGARGHCGQGPRSRASYFAPSPSDCSRPSTSFAPAPLSPCPHSSPLRHSADSFPGQDGVENRLRLSRSPRLQP